LSIWTLNTSLISDLICKAKRGTGYRVTYHLYIYVCVCVCVCVCVVVVIQCLHSWNSQNGYVISGDFCDTVYKVRLLSICLCHHFLCILSITKLIEQLTLSRITIVCNYIYIYIYIYHRVRCCSKWNETLQRLQGVIWWPRWRVRRQCNNSWNWITYWSRSLFSAWNLQISVQWYKRSPVEKDSIERYEDEQVIYDSKM